MSFLRLSGMKEGYSYQALTTLNTKIYRPNNLGLFSALKCFASVNPIPLFRFLPDLFFFFKEGSF